jgi:O-antigen/teichoic acid export membrane protein
VSVAGLGAWSFAMSTVIRALTVIAIPIGEVLYSAFSRLRGQRERIAALWLDSIRLLAALIVPSSSASSSWPLTWIPLTFADACSSGTRSSWMLQGDRT